MFSKTPFSKISIILNEGKLIKFPQLDSFGAETEVLSIRVTIYIPNVLFVCLFFVFLRMQNIWLALLVFFS
jgi:hypothetical protein